MFLSNSKETMWPEQSEEGRQWWGGAKRQRIERDSGVGVRPTRFITGNGVTLGRGSELLQPNRKWAWEKLMVPWPLLCSTSHFLKLLLEQLPVYLPISTLDCELQGPDLAHSWCLLGV